MTNSYMMTELTSRVLYTMRWSLASILCVVSLLGREKGFSYAIATGEADKERLSILNALHNLSSLQNLEIETGMHVLTIGCGIGLLEIEMAKQVGSLGRVVATDLHADQLAIAAQNAGNMPQLQFLQMDAADAGGPLGIFDRIHCRFVLSHLPLDKIFAIIDLLYQKLSPGGFFLLEEIATLDSLNCSPVHPGYDQWKLLIQKQFAAQGSDHSPGKKIFDHLKSKGLSVSYTSYQPVLSTAYEKRILSLGVISVSQKLLQSGLINEKEMEQMLPQLFDLEERSEFFPTYAEVAQIKVYKPS